MDLSKKVDDVIEGGVSLLKSACSIPAAGIEDEFGALHEKFLNILGRNDESYLTSIFSNIDISAKSAGQRKYYHPVPLSNLETFIPVVEPELNVRPGKSLLSAFDKELKEINNIKAPLNRLNTFYYLYQKYTSMIVSPAITDVALFDYWRLLAALVFIDFNEKNVFSLVGGDLSGTQDMLYTIGSAKAAKSLRARSQYLKMISDVATLLILFELNLPVTNALTSAGGNFTLLAPKGAEEKINGLAARINSVLAEAHRGRLSLTIAWVDVKNGVHDLKGHLWRNLLKKLQSKVSHRKRQVLVDENNFDEIFGLLDSGGVTAPCEICGREIAPESEKCAFCESLETDLNQGILNSATMTITPVTPGEDEIESWQDVFKRMGFRIGLHRESLQDIKVQDGNALVLALNHIPDFSKPIPGGSLGFYWLAQNVPRNHYRPVKTF